MVFMILWWPASVLPPVISISLWKTLPLMKPQCNKITRDLTCIMSCTRSTKDKALIPHVYVSCPVQGLPKTKNSNPSCMCIMSCTRSAKDKALIPHGYVSCPVQGLPRTKL